MSIAVIIVGAFAGGYLGARMTREDLETLRDLPDYLWWRLRGMPNE